MDFLTQFLKMALGAGMKAPPTVASAYIKQNYRPAAVFRPDDPASPGAISDLREVRVVDLRNRSLSAIPHWVFDLHSVEGLLFDQNELDHFPEALVERLLGFKVLSLLATGLQRYEWLRWAQALECLDISANKLSEFPPAVCTLSALELLDVSSYNSFDSVPASLGNLGLLRVLRIHYNKIVKLPRSIGDLRSLEHLVAGGNVIQELPESLYRLHKLRELDLHGNKIRHVDFEQLAAFPHLDEIFLRGNPIDNFPKPLLEQDKGVLSSRALRGYLDHGVYFEVSQQRTNDQLQLRRLTRSARALIVRGIYYELASQGEEAQVYLRAGLDLARECRSRKFESLASAFLIGKTSALEIEGPPAPDAVSRLAETTDIASDRDDWNAGEFRRYAERCRASDSATITDPPERDHNTVLKRVFEGKFQTLSIDAQDDGVFTTLNAHAAPDGGTGQPTVDAYNQMNNRDLLRGLLEMGFHQRAWREVARQLGAEVPTPPFEAVAATANATASLCVFQLTNRDRIRVLCRDWRGEQVLLELNSISISLNAIAGSLFTSDATGGALSPTLDPFTKGVPVEHMIWDTLFGAHLIKETSKEKQVDHTKQPLTLHGYLQQRGVRRLKVFPYGSLVGIPLHIARRPSDGTSVLDHYEISNRPPFVAPAAGASVTDIAVTVIRNDELPFSTAEAAYIASRFDINLGESTSNRAALLQRIERSGIAHFSCHGDDGLIHVKMGALSTTLAANDLLQLDLSSCRLVFLNICRASESPHHSLIPWQSLPLAFLEAGAHAVVATTCAIGDAFAFRLALRFYQSWNDVEGGCAKAMHQVLLECKNGTLPYQQDWLLEQGCEDLASHMAYSKRYATSDDSWKFYTLWEANRG